VKTQSKVLNSLGRTLVFLQNSPKKRPFFLSILGVNSAVTALAIAAEELAPVFIPRVFRWKTGDLPFAAAGRQTVKVNMGSSGGADFPSPDEPMLTLKRLRPHQSPI